MARFSYNQYLNSFAQNVFANQTLCKLLYYDYTNPLDQADIADTTILYTDYENQRILFSPFTLNVDDSRITKLAVLLNDITVDRIDYFREVSIDCIIACHNDLWDLNSTNYVSSRPIAIWDELEIIFNSQYTSGVGKDRTSIGNLIYFNDNFSGYRITYNGCSLPPAV